MKREWAAVPKKMDGELAMVICKSEAEAREIERNNPKYYATTVTTERLKDVLSRVS